MEKNGKATKGLSDLFVLETFHGWIPLNVSISLPITPRQYWTVRKWTPSIGNRLLCFLIHKFLLLF